MSSDHYDDGLDHGFVESPSPWTRPGFLVSGGVLALIAIMGIVLALTGRGHDQPTTTPTPKPTPTSSSASDPAASICGLPGHQTTGTLNAAPSDTTWSLVGTIAIPGSEVAGPGVVEKSGLRYCYAHTPAGALLMAANIYANGFATDQVGVVEHTAAAGPGFDAALAAAQNAPPPTGPSTMLQIRGFRLAAYSGGSAMVDIAFQIDGQGYSHHPLNLRWEKGDWRVEVNPDGSLPSAGSLASLAGFVPWAGA